jgi:hypothetical protein
MADPKVDVGIGCELAPMDARNMGNWKTALCYAL